MKECVLVAGGAGYIGTHTAVELIEAGYDVVIVVANENLIHEKAPFLVPFYHSTEQFRKGR